MLHGRVCALFRRLGLYVLLFSGSASAGPLLPGTLDFKSTPSVPPTVAVGDLLEVDLASLLTNPGSGGVTWSEGSKKLPSWLLLDTSRGRLSGTPRYAAAGSSYFTLSVRDSSGAAIVDQAFVVTVSAPPVWRNDSIDLGIQNEGRPWKFDLTTMVQNPAGGSVTFTANQLPDWMSLDTKTGILSGTPARKHVGRYGKIGLNAMGRGGNLSVEAYGLVVKTVQAPKWSARQYTLPDASERTPYSDEIADFVINPENVAVTFDIVLATSPNWLRIGRASGTLFGSPDKANLGKQSISVILRGTIGGQPFEDTAAFAVTVNHVNQAPSWNSKLVKLPDGFTSARYSQTLTGSATDSDSADALTYKMLTGPTWAKLDAKTGILSGVPTKENTGVNAWLLSVADAAGLTDTATFQTTIKKANETPQWSAKPLLLPNVRQDTPFEVDLTGYAKDADLDPLTFVQVDGPTWIQVTPSGAMIGRPKVTDVGPVKFRIKVSDGIAGNDLTEVSFFVDKVNHSPTWILNPIQIPVKEDQPVTLDISAYARDSDPGDSLVFGTLVGAAWAQLSKEGTFTGVPRKENVGENNYTVRVVDLEGAKADVRVVLVVEHVNHKPVFTSDSIALPPAKEKFGYRASLISYVKDPDAGDKITFEKAGTTPNWVEVSADGTVTGTPDRSNLGLNVFSVRVLDRDNEFAIAEVKINVESENIPPRWRQSPVSLTDASEGTVYRFDLSSYGVDGDGDTLTFVKVSGPEWLQVSKDGILSGTPRREDLGPIQANLRVTDGKLFADAPVTGQVVKRNQPPVVASLPLFSVKERQALRIQMTDYVQDKDGDKLHFKMTSSSDWISLSETGELTALPKHKHLGEAVVSFAVDDAKIPVTGTLKIQVLRDARKPVWIEDPVVLAGQTNSAFNDTLLGRARELDNQALTFSKNAGPDWLSVAADGTLSGMPKDVNFGASEFTVAACNPHKGCAEAHLTIKVGAGGAYDSLTIDEPTPGARAEVIWVVDHSVPSEQITRELKGAVSLYFDALKKNRVEGVAIFLSADAQKWDGLPIRDGAQPMLMSSADANPVADFNGRTDLAYSADACSNCYNSPLWSLFRFFERLPAITDVYRKSIFATGDPIDVFVASPQREHYRFFDKGRSDLKDYTTLDFLKSFTGKAKSAEVSMRINALTPACPKLLERSGDEAVAGPENSYKLLAEKTFGRYYAEGCDYNINVVMQDFAARVSLRAQAYAKKRIKLAKVPSAVGSIEVTLAGTVLIGNSGAPVDKWKFDATTNEVILFWNRIDEGQLKSGDTLKIDYRAS